MSNSDIAVADWEKTTGVKIGARIGPSIRGWMKQGALKQNNLVGYLFISPWMIGFLLFSLIPIAISLWLAFTNYDGLSGTWQYVGLDNFTRMFFQDVRYGHALSATLNYVAVAVPARLAMALGVALFLNTKRRGVSLYTAAFYAPSIIGGSVAVAIMWRQLFGTTGLINGIGAWLGLPSVAWLGNPKTALSTLIILAAWQFGAPMLIFLAGLRQIPAQLYEAAAIDGAGAFRKFRNITLPMLSPIIFFNVILQIISGFKVFTQAFIITEGKPLDTTLFYSLYLYQRAFVTHEMGYAAAMAWVLLIIIAALTLISFRFSSIWVFYEAKEV